MYKRIIAVLLLACMLPLTACADFNPYSFWQVTKPVIPSLNAYMNDYISATSTEKLDYLIYEKYTGKPSNIIVVAENYVKLLQETFYFEIIDEMWMDFGTYSRITYSLNCNTKAELSSFNIYNPNDEPTWETPYANVIVQYTVPDSGYGYIHLYYSPELNCEDTLDRYAPPGVKKTTNTSTPSKDTDSSATK